MIKLLKGDCLIESDKIESSSVDLILTDLPYGTVKGLGGDIKKYKRLSNSDWDNVIDTDRIMQIANRILRKNGKMVLTANQPFTTELISKAIPNLPHCYNMYWDKMHFANCLVANKAPVSYIEDILVFSKTHDTEDLHPLRNYLSDCKKASKLKNRDFDLLYMKYYNKKGQVKRNLDHYWNGTQFLLPTEDIYKNILQHTGFFPTPYEELKEIDNKHKAKFASTFNLWEGKKYKSNILKYKKDYDGYHPTQKPVLLLEDLIKTFSNENDLVVDLTMGSGSTLVACKNTNRNGIGIEMNSEYFTVAEQRIKKAQRQILWS